MAKLRKEVFFSGSDDFAVNFFNNLNSPYITAYKGPVQNKETLQACVNIANIFEIKDICSANNVYLYVNGQQEYVGYHYWGGTEFTIAYTDTFIYCFVQNHFGGVVDGRQRICLIYNILDGLTLYGYTTAEAIVQAMPIEEFTLYDVETSSEYHYGNNLIYPTEIGCIDYSPYKQVQNSLGYITSTIVPDLVDCSNVSDYITAKPERMIITFNGKNYLVLGNNTLIEVDWK